MSRGECPRPLEERDGCPVLRRGAECYSDKDHIVPQRYKVMSWLISKYIYTPDNIKQECRWNHEQKTLTESHDLIPEAEVMIGAVTRAYEAGHLALNVRDLQRLADYQVRVLQGEEQYAV